MLSGAQLRSTLGNLRPAAVDLDGDGTGEVLAMTTAKDAARSAFHAVWVHSGRYILPAT